MNDNHHKSVRFADSMGFDLEETKLYQNGELPNVPPEAYFHLSLPRKVTWIPQFEQPRKTPYFYCNVLNKKVQLDHAFIENMEISVIVRVVNLSFEKRVFLRFTHNSWSSYSEKETKYLRHVPQHNVDVFCVTAPLPESSKHVEFAIRYECEQNQYWDNNGNMNYIFDVQENCNGHADKG